MITVKSQAIFKNRSRLLTTTIEYYFGTVMKKLSLRLVSANETHELARYVQDYYRYDNLIYNVTVEEAILILVTDRSLGRAWFIEVDDKMGGYAMLTFGFDIEAGGKLGVITDFFLAEENRDQGFGKQILKLIEDESRALGCRALELFVTNKNARAKKLYSNFGFESLDDRSSMLKVLTDNVNDCLKSEE